MLKHIATTAMAALLSISAIATPKSTTVNHPEWSRSAVIYEVNTRQYTPEGTFNAFASHLPRLKDLGVDILWFMPIHPISELNRKGELGSYYAVADYKGVNPEFGTIQDFKNLVSKAHDMGFKVIIDWVPNHSGCDNPWVTEHPEYYAKDENGNMFGPFDWTDTYKFDYSNPNMRAAMIDAMQFWLRDVDIDGFRCDVAGQVPVDFWDEARPKLEEVKSDIFMLAEATEPELTLHCFDMDYNWPMKDLFNDIAATSGQYKYVAEGQTKPAKRAVKRASDIRTLLDEQTNTYPIDTYMMNMVTNHDLNSWEGTEFKRYGKLLDAFAVLSYTLPGMPLIYTGQETGMDRPFEFFKKDNPPQWEPKNKYFNFYKRLNDLKHRRPELRAGAQGGDITFYPTTSPDIIVFSRSTGKTTTIVGVNLGRSTSVLAFKNKKQELPIEGCVDAFTGKPIEKLPIGLRPGQYFIYTFDEK